MYAIVVSSSDQIEAIVNRAVTKALSNIELNRSQAEIKKVNRREAARLEGISISMLDKVRDNYISERIGSKRVFLVRDGQLVKSSLSK